MTAEQEFSSETQRNSNMTEVQIFNPETSEESKPPNAGDASGSDGDVRGSDSRTESTEELEERDDWRETEENDADDEEEEDEEDGVREKAAQAFTPNVMIVQPTGREDLQMQQMQQIPLHVQTFPSIPPAHVHPAWIDRLDKPRGSRCVEVVRLCVCVTAAAVMFPLLMWAGYKLLPFDAPPLDSTPLRLIYTLRCSFFASIPIVLGVLVQGVSRLRFGTLKPLFTGTWENREVAVHGHYVRDSLHLFLLYFLQLAVMATYSQQEMLKLVPLLSIIFVIGRLIYWVCVAFGSSVRALGFTLSFLPLLVLLAANLYFIGSVGGPEAVFDMAPPTTAPPPKQRWWG